MDNIKFLMVSLVILAFANCTSLPKERLYQFELDYDVEESNDSIIININNTLHCPLQFSFNYNDNNIDSLLGVSTPFILPPLQDTQLYFIPENKIEGTKPGFDISFGDPYAETDSIGFTLPFPVDKEYEIVQAYNGSFSHNSNFSRYAIDFNTQIGDTICAADDGFVVGVIDGYKHGGNNRKWRPYANFITLFHPDKNLYTQYVHINHNGSLVEVGDTIKAGQAIALSGLTGFTSTEHLHFNVLKPIALDMISTPIVFENNLSGYDLKPDQKVAHSKTKN